MKVRVVIYALSGLGFLGLLHVGATAHMRVRSCQHDVSHVTCFNCHLVSTNRLEYAKARPAHDSPAGLVVSPDGKRLFIALDERNEVIEADLGARKIARRTAVGGKPFGLALDSEGKRLFVTCRAAGRIAILETDNLKLVGSAEVGMGPVGVAFARTSAGERLVVANSQSDDISLLSTEPLQEVSRVEAGREPYSVAISADATRALVANRMVGLSSARRGPASEVTEVDLATGRAIRRDALESAHLAEGVCVVPARGWALVPFVKVRNQVPITQVANGWVMSSGIGIIGLSGNALLQMPLDEANDYFADPSGVVAAPDGSRAFVASGGADVVSVIDLARLERWVRGADTNAVRDAIYDLSLSPEYVVARVPTRRNPRQLALTPDGKMLCVAERLQDSVLLVDANNLQELGRIELGDAERDDPVRRGERVFTSAAYTFQHQFSCRSCHPDGHVDGLSYDFDGDGIGDNLLDNRSLLGVAGTAPFKWNGKNPSLEAQCGPRFARVLMRTDPIPSEALHDLTTFIKSLPPPCPPKTPDGNLSLAQERGRAIFFATATPDGTPIPRARRCVTCHRPPLYTVRMSFDVGTKGPFDTTGAFDTPHLLGIGASAPYLHDGRAQSLEEIWTLYNTNDLHGVSSYMNKIQLNDLVEFLKTL